MNTQLLNTAAIIGHNVAPPQLPKLTDNQMKAIAQTMDKLADSLASKVTTEMNDAVGVIIQAKKDWQGGPLVLLSWIKDQFDDATIQSFPTPSSDVGECPDKYKVPYYRDGKLKFKATTFYLELFKRTPAGKAIETKLAHIALAKDEKANKAAVAPDILSLDPVSLDRLKGTLEQERGTAVAAWRSAMGVQKQLDAVNALEHVEALPLVDKEGNLIQSAKPIKVWNTNAPDVEWTLYSIGAFLMFDPAKAGENGGTFEALKLTVKRNVEEGGSSDSAAAATPINTNDTLVGRLNDVAEFIVNKHMADKKRELYGLFLKDKVNGANSDDLIYNLSELRLWVDGILNIPAVQTRLEIINQKKNVA